jgi:hypothetical protein
VVVVVVVDMVNEKILIESMIVSNSQRDRRHGVITDVSVTANV